MYKERDIFRSILFQRISRAATKVGKRVNGRIYISGIASQAQLLVSFNTLVHRQHTHSQRLIIFIECVLRSLSLLHSYTDIHRAMI